MENAYIQLTLKLRKQSMANSISSSSPFISSPVTIHKQPDLLLFGFGHYNVRRSPLFRVHAVKLPDGVVLPKVEPKLKAPVIGFTQTAEIWNSRACMIGLIGTFIVELIIHKGILEVIGLEVGKGLDIPL